MKLLQITPWNLTADEGVRLNRGLRDVGEGANHARQDA